MVQGHFSVFRTIFIILVAGFLAACQTMPKPTGFTAAQIAVLQQEGFTQVDDDWHLTLPSRLLFPSDESTLGPEKLAEITALAQSLIRVDILTAVIEGHTDSTGAADYNLRLSEARAQTVAGPMTAAGMQLRPEQIIGKGEGFPISSNDTPAGRQDNRRVVIIVSPI